MTKQTLLEKDIKATIRLLRFLTHGEGYVGISVFDAGAGGGFGTGSLSINLERSGLILKRKEVYEPDDLLKLIKDSLHPFGETTIEELDDRYKKHKWND